MADTPNTAIPERILVPESARGTRLDAFLGDALRARGISREKIKKALAEGRILRNGREETQGKTPVRAGDELQLRLETPESSLAPEQGDIRLLYRDGEIAVLDKPPHLTVHPCPSQPRDTLAGRLLAHFPELEEQEGLRPGIVHRLDKDTSGLLVVALTEKTRLALSAAFAERRVAKEYLALVHGVPEKAEGESREPLGRHPALKTKMAVLPLDRGGREAHSEYRTLYADPAKRFSLLAVRIHTGRTHQIRVHLAALGHPIWGDTVYGKKAAGASPRPERPPRQMLHAWKLSFIHPGNGEAMRFTCPPPPDFVEFAVSLADSPLRVVITGSPGCGKSSLLDMLGERGYPTWSADAMIRESYNAGGDGAALLRARFGSRFVPDDNGNAGGVDKRALFAAMREDDGLRREVERLIHPLARHAQNAFWEAHANDRPDAEGLALAVAEVPLYLESGWRPGARQDGQGGRDKPGASRPLLVTVYCPFPIRRERLEKTRGWDGETIAAMESWQWPEEEKAKAADIVVDNSGSPQELGRKTGALLRVLSGIAAHRRARTARRLALLWKE